MTIQAPAEGAAEDSADKISERPGATREPTVREQRLQAIFNLDLLDTGPEERFDRLTRLAANIFDVPLALVSLMEGDRQWFKSQIGLDACETESDRSFCQFMVGQRDSLVIEDVRGHDYEERRPQVIYDGDIRFWAGVTLRDPAGISVGSFCIGAEEPREFSAADLGILTEISGLVEIELARMDDAGREAAQAITNAQRDPALPVPTNIDAQAQLKLGLADAANSGSQLAIFQMHVANMGAHGVELSSLDLRRLIHRWATRIRKSSIGVGYFARLSDSDFLGSYEYAGSEQVAMQHYQLLQAEARGEVTLDGAQYNFEVTAGLSLFPHHSEDVETLISNVGLARQYTSVANSAILFDKYMDVRKQRATTLKTRFEKALRENAIGFVWHPIYTGTDLELTAFELLARWHDPELGWITPDEFIPIINSAERLRRLLMVYALDTACKQLALWQQQPDIAELTVAINVPGAEFFCSDFPETVAAALQRHGADGADLVLELSEQTAVEDFRAAGLAMTRITDLGVHIAVDDFGSGYSSIGYLVELPVCCAKIDKSLIQRTVTDDKADHLTKHIVNLAQSQGLTTVAEGIETTAQLELVQRLGCDYIQGFLLSLPLAADAVDAAVAAGKAQLPDS